MWCPSSDQHVTCRRKQRNQQPHATTPPTETFTKHMAIQAPSMGQHNSAERAGTTATQGRPPQRRRRSAAARRRPARPAARRAAPPARPGRPGRPPRRTRTRSSPRAPARTPMPASAPARPPMRRPPKPAAAVPGATRSTGLSLPLSFSACIQHVVLLFRRLAPQTPFTSVRISARDACNHAGVDLVRSDGLLAPCMWAHLAVPGHCSHGPDNRLRGMFMRNLPSPHK